MSPNQVRDTTKNNTEIDQVQSAEFAMTTFNILNNQDINMAVSSADNPMSSLVNETDMNSTGQAARAHPTIEDNVGDNSSNNGVKTTPIGAAAPPSVI